MSRQLYNNIGISALGLLFTLQRLRTLSLPKALLIMPFITHKKLLDHLAHSNTRAPGLDKLIIDKTSWFSNFNRRYFDSLPMSLNAIQFLNELELLTLQDNRLKLLQKIEYNTAMGNRSKKIFQASANIATILNDNEEKLYLNLRIEL